MNIDSLKNKKILLLGKSRAFSEDEFAEQMQLHKIDIVREYEEDVVLLVEGRMMTPYEQNSSDALYESQQLKTISIDLLEELLIQEIDADVLLMSLKLSHDKERLKSFIQNSMVDDALFFQLMKMYKWSGEDFFENDANRDVSSAFISRFYENIERNHNVQYATTGFIHLVSQTKRSELLSAIFELEPMQYHPKMKQAIAMSPYCDLQLQKKLFQSRDAEVLEGLSRNENLDKTIVDALIKDAHLLVNIAHHIKLDDVLFEKLAEYKKELALNESLTLMMLEQLFAQNDEDIYLSLASNGKLDAKTIQKLFLLENEKVKTVLLANSATPQEYLQEAYERGEAYASLAQNENTPVEILYQLQLDARYERAVKTNVGFGKYIQSENIGWLV